LLAKYHLTYRASSSKHDDRSTNTLKENESSPAAHFLNTVFSAAQNAASSLAGLKGSELKRQRSTSQGSSFFSSTEREDSEHDADQNRDHESAKPPLQDVKIEPIRSTISTLGKGELSLASLGLSKEPRTVSPGFSSGPKYQDESSSGQDESESALAEFPKPKGMVNSSVNRGRSTSDANDASANEEDLSPVESIQLPRKQHTRITGFAYANKKRNREFHRLFRSVHPDDYLLDDFSCALSREILVQGRMYVSENHVCFNSNILGWVTNLVIAFDEIVTMEKKNTAGLFPNGIVVQTLHARHSFASFVSRDSVLDFLTSIWKQSSSHQPPRFDGVGNRGRVDGYDISESDSGLESDSERDKDDFDGSFGSYGSSGESLTDDMSSDEEFGESARTHKALTSAAAAAATPVTVEDGGSVGAGTWPVPNEGPESNPPTTLPEPESTEKPLATEIIPAPLGVVANLLFGKDTNWLKRFITDTGKNTNLKDLGPFAEDDQGKKIRKYEYIKPLNGPVGPKQTRCLCTETIDKWDMKDHIIVSMSVVTPDVPSGGSFVTKTKTRLCWAENNHTKLVLSYWLEWSAKSWLKGPIEKGAQDGQVNFAKDLISEINLSLKSGARPRKKSLKGKRAPKKKRKEGIKEVSKEVEPPKTILTRLRSIAFSAPIPMVPVPGWALILTVWIIFILLTGIVHTPHASEAEKFRLLRREEEFQMWKWLDDRAKVAAEKPMVGVHELSERDILAYPLFNAGQKNDMRTGYGSFSQQELSEAIRITEYRLNLLKARLGMN
jgi:hypothetical protein